MLLTRSMAVAEKHEDAFALPAKADRKDDRARAAVPRKRSAGTQKAVSDRGAKSSGAIDTSDRALLVLLKRLKDANDPTEVRQLN